MVDPPCQGGHGLSSTLPHLDLADPFFDSLKADYAEFAEWFAKKKDQEAWVLREGGHLVAFLYLKLEVGPLADVVPARPALRRLKAGTLKVDARGTRLGERFVKIILDEALRQDAAEVYTTVFPKHETLIKILTAWGFERVGTKPSDNGVEDVLVRRVSPTGRGIRHDYPFIYVVGAYKYLLAIKPEYHTRLFPDSKLRTERDHVIQDVAHTNSIFKIYISWSPEAPALRPGDILVIYRMKDPSATSAHYSSVATSLCVVDLVQRAADFTSEADFISKGAAYSVFDEHELRDFWRKQRDRLTVIRMTYNAALAKRPTRKQLIEEAGLNPNDRWTVLNLTDSVFAEILRLGHADERLVVHQARVR